jgi:hypothetical protein
MTAAERFLQSSAKPEQNQSTALLYRSDMAGKFFS